MSPASTTLLQLGASRSSLQAQIDLVRHYVGLLETVVSESNASAAKLLKGVEEALG